jgi:predicted AlkP superfamily phosphohydrolase/phosphomutase
LRILGAGRLGGLFGFGLGFWVLLLILPGCGGRPDDAAAHGKLLIVGLDSADWSLLDPLMEAGRLPHLAAFRAQSTSGRMLSFRPLEKSPLLWASISTGVKPSAHGVGDFVQGTDQTPIKSSAWRAAAIWDIAGAAGKSSAVIGMWATHPAREIRGVMVSDYLPYAGGREQKAAGFVSPDSLGEAVMGLRVDPAAVTEQELARFIDAESLSACLAACPREIEDLRAIYAADRSYFQVARWLAANGQYDLFFFYLRGPDMISHKFWRFHEPDKSPSRLTADEIAWLGQVVPRYYEFADEMVGEVLGWFPAEFPVVMLSDHGFFGPRHRRNGWELGTQEHSPWGIFMVRSPYYEGGTRFDRLELLDICPTFLALLGLPASQEMPGRILEAGLTSRGRKWHEKFETNRVVSYGPLAPAPGADEETDPAVDEKIRQQLRSLGYID